MDIISYYDKAVYPEGVEPESYLWDFGDGYLSVLQNPIHCYYNEGTYDVTFTIYDNYGGETSLQKTLVISSSSLNTPAVADYGYSPVYPIVSENIQFNDLSSDPDGAIISWYWDFDDGTTSTEQNPAHMFTNPGTYTVSLMVTDNDETISNVHKNVVIYEERPNLPPVASFSYQPFNPTDLETVQFNDLSADSDDGTVVSWLWDFGDDTTSTEQNPTHDFSDDGTYTVSLTVWDDEGTPSETYQDSITVNNVGPNADFIYALSDGYSGSGSAITETITVYSTESDGHISVRDMNYQNAWEAEDGDYVSDNVDGCIIGQRKVRSDSQIYRAFLFFDTSDIPVNAVVTNAKLSLYGRTYYSTTGFNLIVQNGMNNHPHNPLTYNDYDQQNYFGNGGSISIDDFNSYSYNNIILNDDGCSWVNRGGITAFCLRTDRDINGESPLDSERVNIETAESGQSKIPKLTITYTYTVDPIGIDFTDTSNDPDGSIVSWYWDFDDGNTSVEQNPTHGFAFYGSYMVTLTVTDDDGLTDEIQKIVILEP